MEGNMNGIGIRSVHKREIKKINLEGALDKMIPEDILKEQMLEAFSDSKNNGRVYAFYKKNKMVACYIICNVPLVEVVPDNKEKRIYELRYHYIIEECEHLQEEMEEKIFSELKELAIFYDIENIILGDRVYVKRKVKCGNSFVSAASLAIIIAVSFGYIFDNIPLGMCIGIFFALNFGYILAPTKQLKFEEKESKDNAVN